MKHKKTLIAGVILSVMFVAFSIFMSFNFNNDVDSIISRNLGNSRTLFWNGFFMIFTQISGAYVVIFLCLLFLIIWRFNKQSIYLVIAAIVSFVGNYVIKLIFQRPRPTELTHLVEESTTSYPSGHATISLCFYLFLAFLLSMKHKKQRVWFFICAGVIALLVSFSRIYLGVHYFTDIIAGMMCGGWMFAGLVICYYSIKKPKTSVN